MPTALTLIHVSRFADELTPGAQPLAALYTIHRHRLKPHRVLVVLWWFDDATQRFEQAAIVDVRADDAVAFIPVEAIPCRPADGLDAIKAFAVVA